MHSVLPSQVTQILYLGVPNFNFAHVVRDVCDAVTPVDGPAPRLTWDCDDIALLDFHAARVVIGFSENIPGPHATCVTVAIGESPQAGSALLDKAAQFKLCQHITDLINHRSQSDAQHSHAIDQPVTPDLIDQLADGLFIPLTAVSGDPQVGTITDRLPDPSSQTQSPEHGDIDRLMRRLSSELVARAPSIISRAIASASPNTRKLAASALTESATSRADMLGTQKAAKSKAGLFWAKAKPGQSHDSANDAANAGPATHSISSNELAAVRAALYAADAARPAGPKRLVTQTRFALKTLTDLSHSLTSAVTDKRRTEGRAPKDGVKH